MHTRPTLAALGWHAVFQRQLHVHDAEDCQPARIVGQERSVLAAAGADFECSLPVLASMPALTVGDWVLLDREFRFRLLLERSSLFARKAAGAGKASQLLA